MNCACGNPGADRRMIVGKGSPETGWPVMIDDLCDTCFAVAADLSGP